MTSHIKERTIPCDQCDRVFNRLQCLRVHIKSAHSDERTHICECGKSYKTHSALYTHIRYWHSDEKKFVCSVCEYVAYDNNKLKDHMRIHSDKPELKCPHCDALFFTLVKLRVHKQITHEEPKYICEFCSQVGFFLINFVLIISSFVIFFLFSLLFARRNSIWVRNSRFTWKVISAKRTMRKFKFEERELRGTNFHFYSLVVRTVKWSTLRTRPWIVTLCTITWNWSWNAKLADVIVSSLEKVILEIWIKFNEISIQTPCRNVQESRAVPPQRHGRGKRSIAVAQNSTNEAADWN